MSNATATEKKARCTSKLAEPLAAIDGLPQSYVITKSTEEKRMLLREHFENNPGKLFTMDELARITGKKWNSAFVYYASRASLDANAPCDFPIVAVKGSGDKRRQVVGYRYQPLANEEVANGVKYRNSKGHPVKPAALVGKWEARETQKAINASKAAEANALYLLNEPEAAGESSAEPEQMDVAA